MKHHLIHLFCLWFLTSCTGSPATQTKQDLNTNSPLKEKKERFSPVKRRKQLLAIWPSGDSKTRFNCAYCRYTTDHNSAGKKIAEEIRSGAKFFYRGNALLYQIMCAQRYGKIYIPKYPDRELSSWLKSRKTLNLQTDGLSTRDLKKLQRNLHDELKRFMNMLKSIVRQRRIVKYKFLETKVHQEIVSRSK